MLIFPILYYPHSFFVYYYLFTIFLSSNVYILWFPPKFYNIAFHFAKNKLKYCDVVSLRYLAKEQTNRHGWREGLGLIPRKWSINRFRGCAGVMGFEGGEVEWGVIQNKTSPDFRLQEVGISVPLQATTQWQTCLIRAFIPQ